MVSLNKKLPAALGRPGVVPKLKKATTVSYDLEKKRTLFSLFSPPVNLPLVTKQLVSLEAETIASSLTLKRIQIARKVN